MSTSARGRRSPAPTIVALAAALCPLALSACAFARGQADATGGPGTADPFAAGYQRVIRAELGSVVEISAGASSGSGVVLDRAGDVVTSARVLGNATTFLVRVAVTSQTLPARLVGRFAPEDLAVIKVTRGAADLTPARWANSARVRAGAIVLAMGSPYGQVGSVTQGIVSAAGRTATVPASRQGTAVIPGAIQTSAAVNPGNAGGALVLLSGQVLGIPVLGAAGQGLRRPAPGVGFAIPADTVRGIARQLIAGKVTRTGLASLQVTGGSYVYPDGAAAGVSVDAVTPGGAAARAGIVPGDVIAGVDGTATRDLAELDGTIAACRPGQQVTVEVLRNGAPRQFTVTLGRLTG